MKTRQVLSSVISTSGGSAIHHPSRTIPVGKSLLLFILLLILAPAVAAQTPTFQTAAVVNSGNTNDTNTLQTSIDVGSNLFGRLLLIGVSIRQANNTPEASFKTVGSMTSSLPGNSGPNPIFLGAANKFAGGPKAVRVEVWYMIQPAIGTHTITATLANGAVARWGMGVALYSNTAGIPFRPGQTMGDFTSTVGDAGQGNFVVNLDVVTDTNDLAVSVLSTDDTALPTVIDTPPHTFFYETSTNFGANGAALSSSGRVATAATTTLSVGINGSQPFAMIGVALQGAQAPTMATPDSFVATRFANGKVAVKWNTTNEVDNLGYHIYREQGGSRVRITPDMIAGSALMIGAGTRLAAGQSYTWVDSQSKTKSGTRYWIEEVDLSGKRTFYGPIRVAPATGNDRLPEGGRQPLTLGQLSSAQAAAGGDRSEGPIEPIASFPIFTAAALETHASIASQRAVKLGIQKAGWYRVTQAELAAAGFDVLAPPGNLQMFVDGKQIPIRVNGAEDGRFDAADSVEFYGTGLDQQYTKTRTYWLLNGAQAGTRIIKEKGQGSALTEKSFPFTVRRKDRTVYFAALLNGEAENFFGPIIAGNVVEQSLAVRNLATTGDGTLAVSVQGASEGAHQLKVSVNGTRVGTLAFTGREKGQAQMTVPRALFREGNNIVTLESLIGSADVSLMDFTQLTYPHKFAPDDGILQLNVPGGRQVSIAGFNVNSVLVFDITDPDNVQQLSPKMKRKGATFTAKVKTIGSGERTLLAFDQALSNSVTDIQNNDLSNLQSADNEYDMVIISPKEYIGGLQPLAAFREGQGLRVGIFDITDIYDEFSFGHKSATAIKNLLSFAKQSWRRAPKYVLLAGDASFDPRDYVGEGKSDIIPTKFIDAAVLETASDDWYVDFNSDGLPEMALGRLPVKNLSEVETIVGKIIAYESNGIGASASRALLAADRNDEFAFEDASLSLKQLLPGTFNVKEVYRGRMDNASAKTALLNGINEGQFLINYIGHGSVELWQGNVLTLADVATLNNQHAPAVFTIFSCLNAYFHGATDSLGEGLVKSSRGGAIAVWASTSLTEPRGQAGLSQEFYRLLFAGAPGSTLGDATMKAKESALDVDVRRSWVLLGDPALRIR